MIDEAAAHAQLTRGGDPPPQPWELRAGCWRDALADVQTVDAVICDPPYSQRTEDGFRSSKSMKRRGLGYDPIDQRWANHFVKHWHTRCSGWICVFGDHLSIRWFESAMKAAGRYVFAPVVIVKRGAAPRLSGDGPGSHCEYLIVSRPRGRRFMTWGSLPGWYMADTVRNNVGDGIGVTGAKHPRLMRRLIQDYSRPGDLIVDPTAGGGTTLLAAVQEGRRAIGAEIDPQTHAKTSRRLRESLRQSDLWSMTRTPPAGGQQIDFIGSIAEEVKT